MDDIEKLIDSKKFEEAELALSDAINQNPDSPDLLNLQADLKLKMGSLYWEKGDIDKALENLTRALEINPFNRKVVHKCGEVFTILEEYDMAKKLYAAYLKKYPDDKEISLAMQKLVSHEATQVTQQTDNDTSKTEPPDISQPILIATNLVPFKDERRAELQQLCIKSINDLKPLNIVPLNICFPDERIEPEGWEVSATLTESADKKLNVQGKRKPFVTDIFNAAAARAKELGIKWFLITNSDIMLTPSLLKEVRLLFKKGYENIAVSRTDVQKIDLEQGYIVGSLEVRGYDVF
ncbi:MAG: tetratricopeptide repeat protein, partial [Nitrospirota bacterium]